MLTLTGQTFSEPTSGEDSKHGSKVSKTLIDEEALLQHYQCLSQQKSRQRRAALNIPFRKEIVAPTQAVSGAWANSDVYSLYDSLISIAANWPNITHRPGQPCPIQFTEQELEYHDNASDLVGAISPMIHQLHNDDLIPLGGIVYAERYEHTVAINKECRKRFVDMAEMEEQRQVASRLWPYQDRRWCCWLYGCSFKQASVETIQIHRLKDNGSSFKLSNNHTLVYKATASLKYLLDVMYSDTLYHFHR